MKLVACLLVLLATSATGTKVEAGANPVRRIVTMLQMMQKKVEAEGEKEEELHEKFMCYCETTRGTLGKAIEEAKDKVPQLESDVKEAIALKAQLEEEIAQHKTDREEANAAMEKATAIREKEAADFAAESGEDKSNLDALTKAIAAIAKGLSGGFLQTNAASVVRKLVESDHISTSRAVGGLSDSDRESLMSFLSEKQGEDEGEDSPGSDEIVGMLKQMKETMEKDLADVITEEQEAIKAYDELMAAKEAEVAAATKAIEEKLGRAGETAVEIVTLKNDLEDTSEQLAEDTKFLADLEKNCATKKKEYEVRVKTRAEEMVALADTIKMLNDDDALELFKKTLPSAAASSFIQEDVTAADVKGRALALIQTARHHRGSSRKSTISLDLIVMALKGKKAGFEKIIKLIDDMVVTLGNEQGDDDKKKDYCNAEFDSAEDKKKETERTIKDLEAKMAETEDTIGTLKDEIKALEDGIAELDKNVVKATAQRKDENAEYTELMASNNAAKQLVEMAKNRMNKFYNPKMYKAPPKRELSEEERITLNMGGTLEPTAPPGGIAGTGISAFNQEGRRMPPPPATFLEYRKQAEASNGVIAMMDGLIAELDKEMTEAKMEEKDAQEDYENFMADSTKKRAEDSKTLGDKQSDLAEANTELDSMKDQHADASEDLMATKKYIADLHADCDFLLQNYDLRREARTGEIEALKKAKAVLNGADYSLLQTSASTHRLVQRHA